MQFPEPDDRWETRFYKYDSPAAKHAVDLSAVEGDLDEALLALQVFQEVTEKVAEAERVTSAALWNYAVTMYSRAFTKGRRPVVQDQLEAVIALWPQAKEVHEHILGVRDKHISHAVSDMERTSTAIELGVNEDGRVRARATGMAITLFGPAGPGIADDFRRLVRMLVDEVRAVTGQAWEAVNQEVLQGVRTPADVQKLPEVVPVPPAGPESWKRSRR